MGQARGCVAPSATQNYYKLPDNSEASPKLCMSKTIIMPMLLERPCTQTHGSVGAMHASQGAATADLSDYAGCMPKQYA